VYTKREAAALWLCQVTLTAVYAFATDSPSKWVHGTEAIEMSTRLPGATLGRPDNGEPVADNVVAAFPSIESARMAADALGSGLIPADKITLAPGEDVGQWPAAYAHDERRQVSSTVASGAILGGLIGGVGALVLAGAIAAMVNADISAFVLLSVMVFGAVGVGAIGGFVSGSTLDQPATGGPSESWPRLNVECETERETESAIRILRDRSPLELYRGQERLA
jgi:hypothetical protein